jgi:hypothetical protein
MTTTSETFKGQLKTWADIHLYMFAGNAMFTLVGKNSRFTYKVRRAKQLPNQPVKYFVSLLNGPDNTGDFAYMGVIDHKGFRSTLKSRISATALSHVSFKWFLAAMSKGGAIPSSLEVWHEGRCGRCGRCLTVPKSIAAGIGPECAGRMAA